MVLKAIINRTVEEDYKNNWSYFLFVLKLEFWILLW